MGTMRLVPYPASDPERNTQETAAENLEIIRQLQTEFPNLQPQLAKMESRWKNALAISSQSRPYSRRPTATPTSQSGRYLDMPMNALSAMFSQSEAPAATPVAVATPKPDPFIGFGNTSLDTRKGFIGGQNALQKTPPEVETAEETSDSDPAETQPDFTELQAALLNFLNQLRP